MKLDKNTVIGFVLLAALFFGYFFFSRQGQLEAEKRQKHIQDSIARLQPKMDPGPARADSISVDSANKAGNAGQFAQPANGTEKLVTVENDLLKIVFTNKGAQPKLVELKKFQSLDSNNVRLVDGSFNKIAYLINTAPNKTANITDLFFGVGNLVKNNDGSQTLTFQLADSNGQSISHQFVIKKNEYMIDWTVSFHGADKLLTQNSLNLLWQVEARQHELDLKLEKTETQIGLLEQDGFDYFTMSDGLNKKWENGLKWLGIKQKFFNSTLIAKANFSYADINCVVPPDSTKIVTATTANLRMPVPIGTSATIPFQIYYGPNDYKILQSYQMEMEDMVNLGRDIYAFVKYINRWIVLPVFNFFTKFVSSYGLVIALLTIFIRLLTSPLVYTSYLSGAKMKALRPELDILKAKHKDDQQAYSMEQMKLFRTAGVNPLGGCIPALLQIPIFFALYSFFNSNIQLRRESFLWAKDLSSYDVIVSWNANIPFIGNHLSLFTLLAVITSLFISLYSMSMTPDQNNPVLKYMPYIFPVLLLGIFNSLPSALTWYYTVSNVITLALQFVIQNYIIDHDKILAQIELNRKKPKSKPKWQERLEQMQDAQKKMQESKQRSQKKN
jgi:YidC/Oxa1 family membrane protein insertase